MNRFFLLIIILVSTVIQAHALTIGANKNNPPFSSLADNQNHLIGFSVDIMQEICKRIKMPCTLTPIPAQDMKDSLIAQKIDLAISAIVIPEQRNPDFLYSLPYMESYARFIVINTSSIRTAADIKNKVVGTRNEPIFGKFVRQLYGNNVKINKYSTLDDLMEVLDNKTIDVAFNHAAAIDYWLASGDGKYRIIGNKLPIGNGYGIMGTPGQEALMQSINQAIQSMMNDGSYARIYSQYFS